MKTIARMTGVKGLLVLAPMALALSTLAPNISYAYDSYDYECLPPYAAYPTCDYPFGYYDDLGIWWPRDHRHFVRHHDGDHGHYDHGGMGYGGHGHGGGGHGGGHGH
jgi:hypothetical protein